MKMPFGKNGRGEESLMPIVKRRARADQQYLRPYPDQPVNLDEPYVPPTDPLPLKSIEEGISNVVEEFNKRAIPHDIPKVYQALIKQLRDGLNDLGKTFIECAREAEELESAIVERCREHEAYMQRELTIVQKIKEKYSAIRSEITAELAEEAKQEKGG